MAGRGRSAPRRGEVAGYLLKLIRESIPLTQEQLAADLGVDRVTVQSWESGRRPFAAVPLGQAIAVRRRLGRLGANPTLSPHSTTPPRQTSSSQRSSTSRWTAATSPNSRSAGPYSPTG